jgi:hypothetical protein
MGVLRLINKFYWALKLVEAEYMQTIENFKFAALPIRAGPGPQLTIGACIVTGKIESYFQSKEKKRGEVFLSKI